MASALDVTNMVGGDCREIDSIYRHAFPERQPRRGGQATSILQRTSRE